jgi:PKD repeat protein
MFRLARLIFDGARHTWDVQLQDASLSAHQDDKLLATAPPRRKVGNSGAQDPLPPLLPTRLELKVRDEGRLIRDAMQGRPATDFRLVVRRDAALYWRGVVGLEPGQEELGRPSGGVQLTAHDGLALLKERSFSGSGTRSVARWIYDLLGQGPVTRPLHTYSTWAASAQTEAALQGLYLPASALAASAPSTGGSEEERSVYDVLEMVCRTFGLQLAAMRGEWIAVQRSYRLQDTLADAPEGEAANDRALRVALPEGDIPRSGGQARAPKRLSMPPAQHMEMRWEFQQRAFRNGRFDAEGGPLAGWEASGVSVIEEEDERNVRHDAPSDYVRQRFQAPPYEDAVVRAKGVVNRTDAQRDDVYFGQLLYHDLAGGQTYSLGRGSFIENDLYQGVWNTGTDSYLYNYDAYDGPDKVIAYQLAPLPSGGAGYFELTSHFKPDPDGDGTDNFNYLDLHELAFEPPAEGYAAAVARLGNTGAQSGRSAEVRTRIGSLMRSGDGSNAEAGALRIDDAGTLALDFDSGTSGRQPFLAEAARDIASQQQRRLGGLDVWRAPGSPDALLMSTLVQGGTRYAPTYAEEVIGRDLRRAVAYEVRSDPVGTLETSLERVGREEEEEQDAGTPPVARFDTSVGRYTVDVDASASSDEDGSVQSYEVDYGDGSPPQTGQTQSHTYDDPGTYEITLTVTDDDGLTDKTSQTVEMVGNDPTASFTVRDTRVTPTGYDADRTAFADAGDSSDPDGQIVRYDWSWGDGRETQDGSETEYHEYPANGTYQAELTVTDDYGNTATATESVTV